MIEDTLTRIPDELIGNGVRPKSTKECFRPVAICDGMNAIPTTLRLGVGTEVKPYQLRRLDGGAMTANEFGTSYLAEGLVRRSYRSHFPGEKEKSVSGKPPCCIRVFRDAKRTGRASEMGREFLRLVSANGAGGHVPRPIALGTGIDGFGPYHAIVTEYIPTARHGLEDYAHTDRDYLVPLAELATLLTRNTDPDVVVGQCATFALSLIDAVRALHAQGVAHGTLRPSQVVAHTVELRRPGEKGAVRVVEGVVLTGMGGISLDPTRSVSYMAPEAMSCSGWGGKLEPTVESDIYGVGTLVYRVLARSDPEWAGNSEPGTGKRWRALVRPRRQGLEIPRPDGLGKSGLRFWEYLNDLVRRCTLRDPRRRVKAVNLDAERERLGSLMGLRMPSATEEKPDNADDYQRISVLSLEPLRDGLGTTGSFTLGRPGDGQGSVASG